MENQQDYNYMKLLYNQLLSALHKPNAIINFRAIDYSKKKLPKSLQGTYEQLYDRLKEFNKQGYCIYITINQTDKLGIKTENITAIKALFIDLDDSTIDNKFKIQNLPVKPSVVVETSANKYHVYWILNVPDSRIELFKSLQKQLAEKFDSDKSVCDLARVMRVPNFYHMKDKSNPFMSKVTIDNDVKYDIDYLIEKFGLSTTFKAKASTPVRTYEKDICIDSPWSRQRLIRFIENEKDENIPISGVNGNTKLTQYFAPRARDYGLPLEVAQELFWEHLNPLCNPPWYEHEKQQFTKFIADGYSLCKSDFGCRAFKPISEPKEGWAQNAKLSLKTVKVVEEVSIPVVINNFKGGLKQFTINGVSSQMTKQMLDDKFVLENIAILGQLTVLYAAPNTGKTLLTIKLLIEAVESGVIRGEDISYINADDNFNASVTKLKIFEKYNIGMIVPDIVKADYLENDNQVNPTRFKTSDLLQYIELMIENKEAKNQIVVLDTLKKFTDLMDKKASSEFAKVLRRFSANGGTVIALAHVNKQSDPNGKRVHAGTTDILDDFDCSYVIEQDGEIELVRRVKFTNNKARGNVKNEVFFTYSIEDKINYNDLLNSVECVDNPIATSPNYDHIKLINKAHELIAQEVNKKTDLINQLHSVLKPQYSKTKVIKLLKLNVGKEWEIVEGKNNASIYSSILP
ncbi:MAG: AAA family ATPase [Colwellia sp.]|nr:AAA family ATPase [Colwellia sp.]